MQPMLQEEKNGHSFAGNPGKNFHYYDQGLGEYPVVT